MCQCAKQEYDERFSLRKSVEIIDIYIEEKKKISTYIEKNRKIMVHTYIKKCPSRENDDNDRNNDK